MALAGRGWSGRLSPSVRDWLLKGHNGRAAFLWDAQGLSLTWPTAHVKPEEVAACAEYGVVLAERLREAAFHRPDGTP